MEKRVLIAIVLSFAVFFGYTKVLQVVYPDYGKKQEPISVVEGQDSAATAQISGEMPIAGGMQVEKKSASVADLPISLESAKYQMTYSANQAAFTELRMAGYPGDESGAFLFLKAESGITGVGAMDAVLVDGETSANLNYQTKRERGQIRSVAKGEKISVEKTWNISADGYANGLEVALTNITQAPIRVRYRLLTGPSAVVHNTIDTQYIEANWLTADKLQHIRQPKIDKPKTLSEAVIAASTKSRHFSSLFQPTNTAGVFSAHVEAFSKESFGSYLVRSESVIAPGETMRDGFVWFAGPNRVEDLGPLGLDRIVNFGKLDVVAKLVLGGLHMVAGVVKNYGVGIILLTIFTNILFMPLTKTSFMSMRRMQLVQPAATKLREKYKDNPTKLNEETMALYKKNKVNPMGGCLPMLLQMPIFMGLYVSLSKAPELLGGSFLWIHDLASPDQVPLPFTLPFLGSSIHLLPLIMVGAMVGQQKFSAASMGSGDPNMMKQQKMMMTIMPIMFGFMFYQMPSGLVIYWLTNTIVMTGYQMYLKKSNPVPTPVIAA
jgi:YidC/Oxa1 family membrane protein insertase